MTQTLNRLEVKGSYVHTMKIMYDKTTSHNHTEWGKKLKNSSKKLSYPISLVLFNLVLGILTRAIRQEKKNKIKYMHIGKEETKFSLLIDNMILHIQKSEQSKSRLLELRNEFSNIVEYKNCIQQSVAPLYANNEFTEIW